jgi:hypothetical protein
MPGPSSWTASTVGFGALEHQFDKAAGRAVAKRVRGEIRDRLADPGRVGVERRDLRLDPHAQLDALVAGGRREVGGDRVREHREVAGSSATNTIARSSRASLPGRGPPVWL